MFLAPDYSPYSPLQAIAPEHQCSEAFNLWFKRDDLIHPLVSGNKWRKLKYAIAQMQVLGKNKLVTFGGAFSNHLLATAVAGASLGIDTESFVRGEDVKNDTLFLCQLHGMKLHFVDRDAYRDKQTLFVERFGDDADAFFVDEGGAGEWGRKGCAEIIRELPEDTQHLVVACGTGTTAGGLLEGLAQYDRKCTLHIIPVLKGVSYIEQELKTISPIPFLYHSQYHLGGYGKTTPELLSFIHQFIKTSGIMIDPVYTGKALLACFDLAQKGHFPNNEKVVFLHTGGSIGILGMKEKFSF